MRGMEGRIVRLETWKRETEEVMVDMRDLITDLRVQLRSGEILNAWESWRDGRARSGRREEVDQ